MTKPPTWPPSNVQSDKLMQIVTVVYGVSLTSALTRNADLILHPFDGNSVQFLCLVCAALLSSYAFFAYVMAVSYDYPYDVRWTVESAKAGAALRFATDLALAVLYVRMLLVAVIDTSSPTKSDPHLRSFLVAVASTMLFAWFVRLVRYHSLVRGIPSLVVGVIAAIAAIHWGQNQTHTTDLIVLGVAIAVIVVYIAVNDGLGWQWWLSDVIDGTLPSQPRDKARDGLSAAAGAVPTTPPASTDTLVAALRDMVNAANEAIGKAEFTNGDADVTTAKSKAKLKHT